MSSILNLDELIPEVRTVTYKGVEHPIEASTETYLKIVKEQKKLDAAKGGDEEEQARFAITLINLAIPSISKEELGKLPLHANMRLVEAIQVLMSEEVQQAGTEDDSVGEATLAALLPG